MQKAEKSKEICVLFDDVLEHGYSEKTKE